MLQPLEQKKNRSMSHVLLLGLAVVIASTAIYYFWPEINGLRSTTQAAISTTKVAITSKINNVSLTAIAYTEDNPMAIVDSKIVHEQDMVGDVKVLKIHKHEVEFESDGRTWIQAMPDTDDDAITSGLPVLLELGSPKCPPCRKMKPILKKMKKKYTRKFQIKFIDPWLDTEAGAQYGVRAIPTQIFYDDKGNELFRHTGLFSKQEILDTWKNLGYDF